MVSNDKLTLASLFNFATVLRLALSNTNTGYCQPRQPEARPSDAVRVRPQRYSAG